MVLSRDLGDGGKTGDLARKQMKGRKERSSQSGAQGRGGKDRSLHGGHETEVFSLAEKVSRGCALKKGKKVYGNSRPEDSQTVLLRKTEAGGCRSGRERLPASSSAG